MIAVAYKELPATQTVCSVADESDLTLLGYIAFLDPPKDAAGRRSRRSRATASSVKMLTGDNDIVTRKICRDVGLAGRARRARPRDRRAVADRARARSRTQRGCSPSSRPTQKARVIDALRGSGHVVGFLGDGINDGPALKAADVGISVDTAVDIAKESADIILLEKNLLVLDEGVIEGPQGLRQHRQVHPHGRELELRQHVQRDRRERLPAVPADGAGADPAEQPALRLLADGDPDRSASTPSTCEQPRRWDIGNIGRFML